MNEETSKMDHLGGLDDRQVEENRKKYGVNILTPPQRASVWKQYIEKYKDPIIQILLVAAAISLVLAFFENNFIETVGIFIAIFLATTIGFIFERDAAKKFDVLTALGEEQPVKVKRNGHVVEVPRKEIVRGDVVLIEVGDEIPADGLLIDAINLQIDESSLTGEPIAEKTVNENNGTLHLTEESTYPKDMVLRSTMVMNGSGIFKVTAVGDSTEIGKVAHDSTEATAVKTPLNIQLDKLARIISKFGFGLSIAAAVIFLVHDILVNPLWHTDNYFKMTEVVLQYFMMAVTLIVMAVPEGLPMAVTLSLALNMRRMLKSNNLVRKLHACETMGAVNVICTDKTGTLTENKMQVAAIEKVSGSDDFLKEAFALNTTAHLDTGNGNKGIGNPTEIALLLWMKDKGTDYSELRKEEKIIYQLPFSTERKYMATVACHDGRTYMFVKGAPEIVTDFCNMTQEVKSETSRKLQGWQEKAMRTLAFAYKELPANITKEEAENVTDKPNGMVMQAIAAITDPVRGDVPEAVKECQKAGIEVKIVTGDTSATAKEIAKQIGIWGNGTDEDSIIAGNDFAALSDKEAYERAERLKVMCRARPADKQRLVSMLQRHKHVVAVTGDGTNDAPALHHAHVGLSLGSSTSVAKEASDMTLLDDSFGSIVNAVMWGRSLYKNIQRFLFFQLTVNVAALLLVIGGSIIGTEMPLTVTQILWVNLIMDTFAAMALASLPPSKEVMADEPRKETDFIITKSMLKEILGLGTGIFLVMFIFLIHCLKNDGNVQLHELSLFFTTFVMMQAWNLLNAKAMGSSDSALHGLAKDKGLTGVMLIILGGQWLIVTFGGKMFRTTPLSLTEWVCIILATSAVLWIGEGWRMISRKGKKN